MLTPAFGFFGSCVCLLWLLFALIQHERDRDRAHEAQRLDILAQIAAKDAPKPITPLGVAIRERNARYGLNTPPAPRRLYW